MITIENVYELAGAFLNGVHRLNIDRQSAERNA
jgi:hypothetical protein